MSSVNGAWKIYTKNPELLDEGVDKLWQEGFAAAPQRYTSENTPDFFPRHSVNSRCRICGKTESLTKEHIPPKESGNKLRTEKYSMSDWVSSEDARNIGKGAVRQGGIFGYTLCRSCNSLTGTRYGGEYQRWAYSGYKVLEALPLDEINARRGPFAQKIQFGTKEHPLHPGALARQVLSMMCSLSGSWDIAETYPIIRSLILSDELTKLPTNLDLGMLLYAGPRSRIAGPQFEINLEQKSWRWVMEIAYPPFAFALVLASNVKEPLDGIIMNDWTTKGPKEPIVFAGEIEIGFGWSPYPGDYRTLAHINEEKDA